MTPNPECATVETTILDALHIMHDGKFLHLPVLDKGELWLFLYSFLESKCFHVDVCGNGCCADGTVAACVDVLQITHAAISMVCILCKSNPCVYNGAMSVWIRGGLLT